MAICGIARESSHNLTADPREDEAPGSDSEVISHVWSSVAVANDSAHAMDEAEVIELGARR